MVEYAPDDPTSSLTQEQLLWLNVENYERIIMESEGVINYQNAHKREQYIFHV